MDIRTSARIDHFTQQFLGKPYIANPQGEGDAAEFDSAPLFRFDGFDCVTYVNNILAMALSHDEQSFEKKLLQINYYNAIPKYENRFHFMSLDWNLENQKNKIVQDVTQEIGENIVAFAEGEIDKPNWFLKKAENETPARAQLLRQYAKQFKKELVRLPYLPLQKLFDQNKNPQKLFFDQIPDVCIIEIVRPNWNLKEKIGTNLHVSHVGFAIRKSPPFEKGKTGEIFFRHASSEQKCVVEILLSDYLKNCLTSETIKGIHIQRICAA